MNPEEPKQTQFLLANLIILTVFILVVVFMIAAYPVLFGSRLAPKPIALTTLRPTLTSSLTATITPVPTSTRTPLPTLPPSITPTHSPVPTSTGTPTLTLLPTLTPAQPTVGNVYDLNNWTPDDADYQINLMQGYPDTLSESARGKDNGGYYSAYYYPALAYREAILRFPDAPQVKQWQWGLAYDLALMGDPTAGQKYAELIDNALNRAEVQLTNLPQWFSSNEIRLTLYTINLKPQSGMASSTLVEIRGNGSSFLWVIEQAGVFKVYALTSGFDSINAPKANSIFGDLTGDGIEDIVIYNSNISGTVFLSAPQVFSLAQLPPKQLLFSPGDQKYEIGMEFANFWEIAPNSGGSNDLVFTSSLYPPCPVRLRWTYHWDGTNFKKTKMETISEVTSDIPYPSCNDLVAHANIFWSPQAAYDIMVKLDPGWPPPRDQNGQAYPADAKDEWHFRMGIDQALLGNRQKASEYFNQVVNQPVIPISRWIQPARQFQSVYQHVLGIYVACAITEMCIPADAIRFLMEKVYPELHTAGKAPQDPAQFLIAAGVNISSSGYFDFDNDNRKERWLAVRNRPYDQLEFWILVDYAGGTKAIRVNTINSNPPQLSYFNPDQTPPIVQLEDYYFTIQRDSSTQEPFAVSINIPKTYPDHFLQTFKPIEVALFSAQDPMTIHQQLLGIQKWPGLLCKTTWSCDEYYYNLGLASQLAGDNNGALDGYMRLWWDYSKSPFTIMARLKIKSIAPPPTQTLPPTWTPTITRTGTATRTPTITQTKLVTSGPSPTLQIPSPTLSGKSPTPTLFSTPAPTATTQQGYPNPPTLISFFDISSTIGVSH